MRTLLAPRVAPTQPALSVAVQETDTGSDVSTKNLVTTPTKFPGVKDKEVRFDISQEKNKKNTKGEGRQEDVTRGGQGHKLTRQDAEDKLTNSDLFEPDTLTSQKEPAEKVTTGQSTHGTTEPLTTVDKLTEEEVGKFVCLGFFFEKDLIRSLGTRFGPKVSQIDRQMGQIRGFFRSDSVHFMR